VAVGALLLVNGTDNLLLSNATDDLLLARSSTLAATLLTSSYDNVDRTSYTTASISPAANSLLLLFVTDSIAVSSTAPESVPTGLSLTWERIGTRAWGATPASQRSGAWIAQCGASPGSGTVTLTENDRGSGTTSVGTAWAIIQITGHHVAQPVRQVQYPGTGTTTNQSGPSGTSHTITMLDAADGSSRAFSYFAHAANEATTFRTNWSELSDDAGGTVNLGSESQWRSDEFEATASASWSTSVRYMGFAVEIAEANAANIARATIATYAETVSETSPVTVNMPTDIDAGDLLVAYVAADANDTVAAGGGEGWTSIEDTSNGSAVRLKIFAKVAAGSDALTLTVGSSNDTATYVQRITNHGVSNVSSDIELGTAATGTDAAPNPPSKTPSSSKAWLVVACNASDDDDNVTPFAPSGYVPLGQTESAGTTSSSMMQVACDVQTTGSAIDPGAFALAASEEWVAQTLLIPPVSAGATGTAAVTEAADTSTASGTETFTGTVAVTEAADTSTATGTETFAGTVAAAEADDTSTASGAETFTGTSATTEEADTSTASGTHIENVTGSAAATEADDSSTASGTETFTGTSAATEADDTSTAAGTLTITGTVAVTEAADTSTASGTVTLVVLGDISAKLHPVSTLEPAAAVSTLEPATTVHTFAPATTVRTFNA
jgi:hypothetical protein